MNVWLCGHLPEENGPMRPLWPASQAANGRYRKTQKNNTAVMYVAGYHGVPTRSAGNSSACWSATYEHYQDSM